MKRALPFLLGVALFFATSAAGAPFVHGVLKPLPVLALAIAVATSGHGFFRRAVVVGLLLSAAGDVLLEIGRFLPGLLAFLGAHLAYTGAFLSDERRPAPLHALPFVLWAALLTLRVAPGLGSLLFPVLAYVIAICAMMWRAATRVGRDPGRRGAWAGLVGAVSFGLSDSLIASDRFVSPMPYASAPIMVLYWLGQAGIAKAAIDKESR